MTENKNRSASNIRTILQKNGGRLGETGSTSHLFYNCGVMHVSKEKFNELAKEAKDNCPISGALNCQINLNATLV